MLASTWSLRRLNTVDDAQIEGLADVLLDCVEGGASVSFMLPLTRELAARKAADDGIFNDTFDHTLQARRP